MKFMPSFKPAGNKNAQTMIRGAICSTGRNIHIRVQRPPGSHRNTIS